MTRGKGAYQAEVAISGRVIVTLAATGAIVRGANDGGWKTLAPALDAPPPTGWARSRDRCPRRRRYAALVGAWLRSFGPGTEDDLVWWLGATKAAVRRALADVEAVEVSLDGGATGWVLPDDLDEVADPATGPRCCRRSTRPRWAGR